MSLTYKEVAEIIKIIDASNLDELVIEIGGAKMHVRRNGSGGQTTALPAPSQAPVASCPPPRRKVRSRPLVPVEQRRKLQQVN